ncbi:hypothetical protein MHEC_22980 [Mycobacterium heckeshornense]|uniref:Uncharacterized protein n=1 Tax=Mycobacterium heckeshornense TaxID=110505 RepID=A0A7R7GUF3_9MYCO|nr:hypothetical protein MHEC_22980 [Mycobacterium heckeshornense]
MWPLVVNILEPLITHWSPSRTARVVAAATSEPHSGSVKPNAMVMSPFIAPPRIRSFISGVPTARMIDATMRVVSDRYIGASARMSSSWSTCSAHRSRFCPPILGGPARGEVTLVHQPLGEAVVMGDAAAVDLLLELGCHHVGEVITNRVAESHGVGVEPKMHGFEPICR